MQAVDECQRPEHATCVASTRNFVAIKSRTSDPDTVHSVTATFKLPPSVPDRRPGNTSAYAVQDKDELLHGALVFLEPHV